MALNELLDTYTTYAKPLGVGTLVGVGTYLVAALEEGIRRNNTNVSEQLRSGTNVVIGIVAGILTTAAIFDPNLTSSGRDISDMLLNAVGTIVPGAVTGATIYTLVRSGRRWYEGLTDHLGEKLRIGASRGALAFPAGYLMMETLSKHF